MYYFPLNKETSALLDQQSHIGSTTPLLRIIRSDLPTVIYSPNRKLVFANVNFKEINHIPQRILIVWR